MKRYATIFLLPLTALAMALAFGSKANAEDAQADIVFKHDYRTYRIQTDGQYTWEADEIVQVLTAKGAERIAQHPISYNALMQTLDVLDAYTETPEGKKLPVDKEKIFTKEAPQSANAQTFADYKVVTIVFPQVGVGSKLHYRYRRTQKIPLFPGQFAATEYQIPHVLSEDTKVTVYAVKGIKLVSEAVGFTGGAIACPSQKTGKQCFEWKIQNFTYVPEEFGSVDWKDYSQHIAISTFSSYASIAAAYLARSRDKVEVTPAIQTMADNLTKGVDDKGKQAEAIYKWVARNIRYVAIHLGTGAVVPHTADSVLSNRYGDCKDHVALLEAMLKAKGIASTGVLVNAGGQYDLPKVPSLEIFNHIITYIPSLHRYVDSTAQFATFGTLPLLEFGKSALILAPEEGQAQLNTIPIPSATATHSDVKVKMKATDGGAIEGHAEVADLGVAEMADRTVLATLSEGQEADLASRMLTIAGQTGSGKFDIGEPRKLSEPYTYSTNFTLPDLIRLPGPGAFVVPTGFHSMSAISQVNAITVLQKHNYPIAGCADNSHHEDYRIELPRGLKIMSLPKNTSIKEPIGSYTSSYDIEGQTLHVVREMSITPGSATCSPSQYAQLYNFAQEINKDLRSQVLYR